MIIFLIASVMAARPDADDLALRLCKPALARKVHGEIATINVSSATAGRHGRTIEGQLTAFLGMPPAPPGSASAHHLIRSDFRFRCRVSGRRVREAAVNPLAG